MPARTDRVCSARPRWLAAARPTQPTPGRARPRLGERAANSRGLSVRRTRPILDGGGSAPLRASAHPCRPWHVSPRRAPRTCGGRFVGVVCSTFRKWCRMTDAVPKPACCAICSRPSSVSSSSCCARRMRCRLSQAAGVVPISARNLRAKVRDDMSARRASWSTVRSSLEVLQHPLGHERERVAAALGHRGVDVLRLPAVALRRHDHAAGDDVGGGGAELLAHDVQGGVDAGGGAGARDDVPVLDEQHVGVDVGARDTARRAGRCASSAWSRGDRRGCRPGRARTRRCRR